MSPSFNCVEQNSFKQVRHADHDFVHAEKMENRQKQNRGKSGLHRHYYQRPATFSSAKTALFLSKTKRQKKCSAPLGSGLVVVSVLPPEGVFPHPGKKSLTEGVDGDYKNIFSNFYEEALRWPITNLRSREPDRMKSEE